MIEENTPTDSIEIEKGPEIPELLKPVVWAWHHSRRNRELLLKAPVLAFAGIALLVGYWLGSSKESGELKLRDETLNTRNERISFLSDQLTAYKDRLKGATPDEAAKEIAELRSVVASQEDKLQILIPDNPRQLTNDIKNTLQKNIDSLSKQINVLPIYATEIGDLVQYAAQFLRFFEENKVKAIGLLNTICANNERGVIVGLLDPDKPSEQAKNFTQILVDAGLKVSHTRWAMPQGITTNQDFDLFICGESVGSRFDESPQRLPPK